MTPTRHQAGLVTIVLPARNEELAIARTLRSLPLATLQAAGFEVEVFVLDGHSTDKTAAIATEWGATVLPDRERGKGHAVRNARSHFRGDYVVMLDADGTYAADAIPRMLARIAWGDYDVAMGRRKPQEGAMTASHKVGNVLLSTAARIMYGRSCPDLCTGLWAFRADALRDLPLRSRGFGLEAELFALAARRKLRIVHVDADYLPRRGPTKLSWASDGSRILLRLVRSRFARMPKPHATTAFAASAAPRTEGHA